MAEHSHPALALTAIETSDLQPDPDQLTDATVAYLRHMDFSMAADHVRALAEHKHEEIPDRSTE